MTSYVERSGDLILRPPFLQKGVQFDCFWLRANRTRLHALLHRQFTQPSNGAVTVEPLSDGVAFVVAQIEAITSLDPAHRDLGSIPEIDVAFWIPVRVQVGKRETVRWVIPYLFVDNPYALATGRELYGFQKTLGMFDLPPKDAAPRSYKVRTWSQDRIGPKKQVQLQPLLELERTGDSIGSAITSITRLRQVLPLLVSGDDGKNVLSGALGHVKNLFRDQSTPILFLRQLRDLHDPTRAAFQEILEADMRVVRTGAITPLSGSYQLRLHPSVTHPIAEDFGLSPHRHDVVAAFRAEFDCIAEAGRTLWRAAESPSRISVPVPAYSPIKSPHTQPARRKVAILGGGAAALTAALALTSTPALRAKYKVTIYQEGFRLGGKGASGRNSAKNERIEEHGLHVWFGCYENAFRVIRSVFEELHGPELAPARFNEAFHPYDVVILQEFLEHDERKWVPWALEFPRNNLEPGRGGALSSPNDWLRATLRWTRTAVAMALDAHAISDTPQRSERIARNAVFVSETSLLSLLDKALRFSDDDRGLITVLQSARKEIRERLWPNATTDDRRRLTIIVDLAITGMIGTLADGVLIKGYEAIDEYDFMEWLARHGALVETQQSAPVRALYSLCFAYENGDPARPNFSASAALATIARLLFAYSGAFMWKMQGGMGDVIFAPIYEVLQRRGVRFEFFHRIENVRCSPDGSHIALLDIARQAELNDGEYDPLVEIDCPAGRIRAWPNEPRFEQLVNGESLRAGKAHFEGPDTPVVSRHTLEVGRDFDDVVLGISLGALREVCADIVTMKPSWRAMVDNMGTVGTIASQLWFEPDLRSMGFQAVDPMHEPVLTAYTHPLDTWADMTHTALFECWTETKKPGHIAYFCGAYNEIQPQDARDATSFLLDHDAARLFPRITTTDGKIDRHHLVSFDDNDGDSRTRFEGQYFRVNNHGSERYVQSLKGTGRYRMASGDSGLRNLFLAGDWTDTKFNVGCLEAAVVSGLQCARALGVDDFDIYGESMGIRSTLKESLTPK